jgi:hypothetical protein
MRKNTETTDHHLRNRILQLCPEPRFASSHFDVTYYQLETERVSRRRLQRNRTQNKETTKGGNSKSKNFQKYALFSLTKSPYLVASYRPERKSEDCNKKELKIKRPSKAVTKICEDMRLLMILTFFKKNIRKKSYKG